MGRTAIGLGVANVYLGLIVEGDVSGGYVIAYSVVRTCNVLPRTIGRLCIDHSPRSTSVPAFLEELHSYPAVYLYVLGTGISVARTRAPSNILKL
jgi:hypothetical protein